jgi:hypothetical protein
MLMNKFTLTNKRILIGVIVICIVAVSGITLWLNTKPVAQAAVINPHPGLVGWWRFDEGTGTTAGDSSGNGNNGTIYGATYTAGKYGQALSFDGTSSYVAVPDSSSLQITGAITLMAWVKTNDLNKQAVITKSGGYLLYVGTGGDGAVYGYLYGTTSGWLGGSTDVADGLWHLIALTYDPNAGANNFKLYVDGALNAQYTVTGSISPSTNRIGIGDRPDVGYRDFFSGTIDEARVYNRVLSASEIQADFQGGPNNSINLVAKVPQGTTQVITTLSWQGTGSINVTIVSPSQTYTESMLSEYQKTTYSTSGGLTSMLNIKRLSVSVNALSSDQSWNVELTLANVGAYQITVEVQK